MVGHNSLAAITRSQAPGTLRWTSQRTPGHPPDRQTKGRGHRLRTEGQVSGSLRTDVPSGSADRAPGSLSVPGWSSLGSHPLSGILFAYASDLSENRCAFFRPTLHDGSGRERWLRHQVGELGEAVFKRAP